MANSSNHPSDASERTQDLEYLYASNTNVSNFVTEKLSGESNYHLWKTQMICLMDSHDMRGLVDDAGFDLPRFSSTKIMKQYESLLKGWIFGSINGDVLSTVYDLDKVKDVWNKLKSLYDIATKSAQQDSAQAETKEKDVVLARTQTNVDKVKTVPTETKGGDSITTSNEKKRKDKEMIEIYNDLCDDLDSWELLFNTKEIRKNLMEEKTLSNGNSMLHLAVGLGHNSILERLLDVLEDEDLPKIRNNNGSTALHVAAIVGNTVAAKLLIEKNGSLLKCQDSKGRTPLHQACECMRLKTVAYLLNEFSSFDKSDSFGTKMGVDLLVNAISAKRYDLAKKVVERSPELVVESDEVLMGIATTFPSGLHYTETLIYPSLDPDGNISQEVIETAKIPFQTLTVSYWNIKGFILDAIPSCNEMFVNIVLTGLGVFVAPPILMLLWIYYLIGILISLLYYHLFKVATTVVAPLKNIEGKKRECEEAKEVLVFVCDKIEALKGSDHSIYSRPILEAARQNAYTVVEEILSRWPEAIQSEDKNGHDIIQLATIHRSEKVYNLIYMMRERTRYYRTRKDSADNNMLHLAGRLAPEHKLQRTTGAALQLQRELQWREEVKNLVYPSYRAKKNILMETPDMVFTKEHKNLVKEGEEWMKVVAESCSITSTLIATIMFAAAITVPGGSDQTKGTPLLRKEIAFTIFAISDAISLFSSVTALLLFLSILTARFAEQDFLVSLPKRLIIGLCALLLSTIAMMVSFGATLFLVFCHHKPWMLVPISALACIPIASFVGLQFPLIVDLFRSTYTPNFGFKSVNKSDQFDPEEIRFFFD